MQFILNLSTKVLNALPTRVFNVVGYVHYPPKKVDTPSLFCAIRQRAPVLSSSIYFPICHQFAWHFQHYLNTFHIKIVSIRIPVIRKGFHILAFETPPWFITRIICTYSAQSTRVGFRNIDVMLNLLIFFLKIQYLRSYYNTTLTRICNNWGIGTGFICSVIILVSFNEYTIQRSLWTYLLSKFKSVVGFLQA